MGGNWQSFPDFPHYQLKTSVQALQSSRRIYAGKNLSHNGASLPLIEIINDKPNRSNAKILLTE
jgi:hypothetical protein